MPKAASLAQVQTMAQAVRTRGPDDEGAWSSEDGRIAFGFRRLAVLDLSPAGHQPMISAGGRYLMVLNGEIYNHAELRKELTQQGTVWRGHSDTEVVLAAFESWGIFQTLERSVGMFALAVWDRQTKELTLARDRFGEKPLYYGFQRKEGREAFLFGSELTALRHHPYFETRIDREALQSYLRYGYVPTPLSIFRGICKLEPGHLLILSQGGTQPKKLCFWDARKAWEVAQENPWAGSFEEAVEELKKRLRQTLQAQMVADVPVGAWLSGGIDSSTIVALMQEQSAKPIKTFTVGFHEKSHNESAHAQAVARHLGTDHTEIHLSPRETLGLIPEIAAIYSEPFADSSQIPTVLVSRLARQKVTVALSGDGGDEIFGGYNRHRWGPFLWQAMRWMPAFGRRALSESMQRVTSLRWDIWLAGLEKPMPPTWKLCRWREKIQKAAGVLASASQAELYHGLISTSQDLHRFFPLAPSSPAGPMEAFGRATGLSPVEQIMIVDTQTYLPDDILTKVDRASMAVSLEVRAPFLDHRIFHFAWSLPMAWKLKRGNSKIILRKILRDYVPPAITERPKTGFAVPLDAWLRGPLRPWAEELLAPEQIRSHELLDSGAVRRIWQDHQKNKRSHSALLWNLLMLQTWLKSSFGSPARN